MSLVKLIANPEEYSGSQVEVFGWLQRSGGLLLYLTNEHAMAADAASSITVLIEDTLPLDPIVDCANDHVFVSGRVSLLDHGEVGLDRIRYIDSADREGCYDSRR
ncbi:MAG: hypothetical protein RIC56_17030 [Pseudomonadales bacterium]